MTFEEDEELEEEQTVSKLSDMTCRIITRREDLTVGAVRYLPHKFTSKLLKFAIEDLSYPSLKLLLSNYRSDMLSLSRLCVIRNQRTDLNRIGTAVIRVFFESLEERIPLYVKTLDVTGFPMYLLIQQKNLREVERPHVEIIRVWFGLGTPYCRLCIPLAAGPGLAFLTIQGMLAHSEAQRTRVLKVVERAKEMGRITGEQADPFGDLNLKSTIPPGSYSVLFDCHLSDIIMVKNLAQALKVSQLSSSQNTPSVHLAVHRIQFHNIDIPHILTVVELIEPQYLRGVKLSNCENVEMVDEERSEEGEILMNGWVVLAEVLERFGNLDSLELNAVGLRLQDEHEEELATRRLLQQLPKLERLSFWMSKISRGGRLRPILQECQRGLTYLNLRACNLSALDLMYLNQASMYTATLKEIDLSENMVVSSEITTTCCLLKACRRSLKKILLAFCGLQTHHFDRLVANLTWI